MSAGRDALVRDVERANDHLASCRRWLTVAAPEDVEAYRERVQRAEDDRDDLLEALALWDHAHADEVVR